MEVRNTANGGFSMRHLFGTNGKSKTIHAWSHRMGGFYMARCGQGLQDNLRLQAENEKNIYRGDVKCGRCLKLSSSLRYAVVNAPSIIEGN